MLLPKLASIVLAAGTAVHAFSDCDDGYDPYESALVAREPMFRAIANGVMNNGRTLGRTVLTGSGGRGFANTMRQAMEMQERTLGPAIQQASRLTFSDPIPRLKDSSQTSNPSSVRQSSSGQNVGAGGSSMVGIGGSGGMGNGGQGGGAGGKAGGPNKPTPAELCDPATILLHPEYCQALINALLGVSNVPSSKMVFWSAGLGWERALSVAKNNGGYKTVEAAKADAIASLPDNLRITYGQILEKFDNKPATNNEWWMKFWEIFSRTWAQRTSGTETILLIPEGKELWEGSFFMRVELPVLQQKGIRVHVRKVNSQGGLSPAEPLESVMPGSQQQSAGPTTMTSTTQQQPGSPRQGGAGQLTRQGSSGQLTRSNSNSGIKYMPKQRRSLPYNRLISV